MFLLAAWHEDSGLLRPIGQARRGGLPRTYRACSSNRFSDFSVGRGRVCTWCNSSRTLSAFALPNVLQFFALCEILEISDINRTFQIGTDEKLFSKLNDEGQAKVLDYMNLLMKSGEYIREEPIIYQFPRRTLSLYDLPVSAGTGQFLDSDRFSEIEVGDEVSSSADFGVRVCGDSMEPLYLDGQIIWIHKQETLEEGEIGVFFLDGDAYVKKYHQSDSGIQLISLNKKYAPIQVTSGSTLKTFGKVVG